MCTRMTRVAGTVAALSLGLPAFAGGYLWLGAEFQGEGNYYYRFNIDTCEVDFAAQHAGSDHWNNMATDGSFLYIAHPTSQLVTRCDAHTGEVISSFEYTPGLSGHREDGAYRASTGTLWRATFSGNVLHETTTGGVLVQSYGGVGSLVGIEWVGETLYATNWNGGGIGEIVFDGDSGMYVDIPWSAGGAPNGSTAALAYDPNDDVLYMTTNQALLYTVTFEDGAATATLKVDLETVGYPNGGLPDGMGWVCAGCFADFNCDGQVDGADLGLLLGSWGGGAGATDLSGDGLVDGADLGLLLGAWGTCR